MADDSVPQFPEEQHDEGVEEIGTFESLCLHIYSIEGEPSDRTSGDQRNQVNSFTNLFHPRVEQSHLMSTQEFVSEAIEEPSLGVIEGNCEMGANCSHLELGLGSGIVLDWDSDDDDICNCGGPLVSDCGESGNCNPESSLRLGGVRVIEINSDSDSDVKEGNLFDLCSDEDDNLNDEDISIPVCWNNSDSDSDAEEVIGFNLHAEVGYAVANLNDEDIGIPLCWDAFHLEDQGESNNDFGWEEVDDGIGERGILNFGVDPDDEGSISVVPIMGSEEEGNIERGRGLGNFEWEVLTNADTMGRNPELESDPGPYFSDYDDYSNNAEYEMMFGALADGENPLLARPPASKSAVMKLPSVVITQEDVSNENTLCAVCKDQMEVNEEVKQLPCSHWYHGDCILPWLGIRNTCPVCRYELPCDDPDYELRRTRRIAALL